MCDSSIEYVRPILTQEDYLAVKDKGGVILFVPQVVQVLDPQAVEKAAAMIYEAVKREAQRRGQ